MINNLNKLKLFLFFIFLIKFIDGLRIFRIYFNTLLHSIKCVFGIIYYLLLIQETKSNSLLKYFSVLGDYNIIEYYL